MSRVSRPAGRAAAAAAAARARSHSSSCCRRAGCRGNCPWRSCGAVSVTSTLRVHGSLSCYLFIKKQTKCYIALKFGIHQMVDAHICKRLFWRIN